MPAISNSLNATVARKMAERGIGYVRPKIRSRQLREGLYLKKYTDTKYSLAIPHYWAVINHDGRYAVTGSPILVWFRNRMDDPRLQGGRTPQRLSQVRRLTGPEFREWSAKNRAIIQEHKKQTGKRILTSSELESLKLPMIVARMSPRGGGRVGGELFFSNRPAGGMAGFKEEANRIAFEATRNTILDSFKKAKLWNKKSTVKVKISM